MTIDENRVLTHWWDWTVNDDTVFNEYDNVLDYQAVAHGLVLAKEERQTLVRQQRETEDLGRAVAQQLETAQERIGQLLNDLTIIGESLRDEAMRREWCGDYGVWIDRINELTSEAWLQHCLANETRVYRVRIDISGRPTSMNDAWNDLYRQLTSVGERIDVEDIDDITVEAEWRE